MKSRVKDPSDKSTSKSDRLSFLKPKKAKRQEIETLVRQANECFKNGEYLLASQSFRRALAIQRQLDPNPDAEVELLISVQNVQRRMGDHVSAMGFIDEALEICKKSGNLKQKSECLLQRGVLLRGLGRLRDSISDFEACKEVTRDLGAKDIATKSLIQIAKTFAEMRMYSKARMAFEEAQQICCPPNSPLLTDGALNEVIPSPENYKMATELNVEISRMWYLMQNNEMAIQVCRQALLSVDRGQDPGLYGLCAFNLSVYLAKENLLSDALALVNQSVNCARVANSPTSVLQTRVDHMESMKKRLEEEKKSRDAESRRLKFLSAAPNDVILNILRFACETEKEVVQFGHVSKAWRKAASSPLLWESGSLFMEFPSSSLPFHASPTVEETPSLINLLLTGSSDSPTKQYFVVSQRPDKPSVDLDSNIRRLVCWRKRMINVVTFLFCLSFFYFDFAVTGLLLETSKPTQDSHTQHIQMGFEGVFPAAFFSLNSLFSPWFIIFGISVIGFLFDIIIGVVARTAVKQSNLGVSLENSYPFWASFVEVFSSLLLFGISLCLLFLKLLDKWDLSWWTVFAFSLPFPINLSAFFPEHLSRFPLFSQKSRFSLFTLPLSLFICFFTAYLQGDFEARFAVAPLVLATVYVHCTCLLIFWSHHADWMSNRPKSIPHMPKNAFSKFVAVFASLMGCLIFEALWARGDGQFMHIASHGGVFNIVGIIFLLPAQICLCLTIRHLWSGSSPLFFPQGFFFPAASFAKPNPRLFYV